MDKRKSLLTANQERLAELLLGVSDDQMFFVRMMSLAKQCDLVVPMADLIEECGIQNESELYAVICSFAFDDEQDLIDILFPDSAADMGQ